MSASLVREFGREQLPLICGVLALGVSAAYWQHGFMPGGDAAFPLASVRVPPWHLFWMGLWTGYVMALVGEAAGIFVLPYQMSVLQFTAPSVTPTTQLITFLNPLGALFGFRRARQWNADLALWVCLGGAMGALIGPFIRVLYLPEAKSFTLAMGIALALAGAQLGYAAMRRSAPTSAAALPANVAIETLGKRGRILSIGFSGQQFRIDNGLMFAVGFLVGIVATALGVGGGFLLVPILAAAFGLPMYVLVAATIPYVVLLSAVGLCMYGIVVPAMTGTRIPPEWAWGFFAAAGGILGSWLASKSQRFMPQHMLKLMLGAITGTAGLLYVADYFFTLPFKL